MKRKRRKDIAINKALGMEAVLKNALLMSSASIIAHFTQRKKLGFLIVLHIWHETDSSQA